MSRTDYLTLGFDDSPGARTALRWALDEAGRTGAVLRLAFVLDAPAVPALMPYPIGWPDQAAMDVAVAVLDGVAEAAARSHPGVAITRAVLKGAPARVLEDLSRTSRLLVLGSHGHGGFTGMLLGSTGVSVSAHAHCPVVVVRREADPRGQVAVGLDGSPASRSALRFAVRAAVSRGVPLHAIRVWAPPAPLWQPPGFDPDAVLAAELAALGKDLAAYPEPQITAEVVAGHPAGVLVSAARHAQLVVVGSRGHGGFTGMLLGSVSQHLLHHAPCPVAVVREPAPSTPDVDH
ncbi:universal stress protein [Catenuloplanes indicus]|uniref:Nucleotide-binding universal stress UspA family protein n=1 Tax=Catenuloplanes indicus TaxID=137267 RepID=A0AAE3VTI8_9ACTN|nr:universal stress protein [Catenuloplanes indicus]MDQ0363576.1 nucleotide-binding universal stress UspA family protein [Catenuloplanes indicus]